MTAIVGVTWEGGALLAADSGITDTSDSDVIIYRERSPKVVARGTYLIGAAGDSHYCQAVLTSVNTPFPGGSLCDWVYRAVMPTLREKVPEDADGEVIIAAPGQLVVLQASGANDFEDDHAAIGSGYQVALGALVVAAKLSPMRRARLALAAASRYVVTVCPPWRYVTTDGRCGTL